MILLRYYFQDGVIKLLYSLYAFIALSFDILHLWRQYMCGKWILAHICYAFGFAPRTRCDTTRTTKQRQRKEGVVCVSTVGNKAIGWIIAQRKQLRSSQLPMPQSGRIQCSKEATTVGSWKGNRLTPFPNWFWWLNCPTQIIGLTSLL